MNAPDDTTRTAPETRQAPPQSPETPAAGVLGRVDDSNGSEGRPDAQRLADIEALLDVPDGRWMIVPIAAIQHAARDLLAEVKQLTYERRLLGVARMTLDAVAARGPEWWNQVRAEAEDVAQRIVDEIGHPVTDEPALGPTYRRQIAELQTQLADRPKPVGYVVIEPSCLPSERNRSGYVPSDTNEIFAEKETAMLAATEDYDMPAKVYALIPLEAASG